MLEELWTEVHDIVQEAVIKTILKIKKCKKAKWLSEEVLQITEKREAKGKGEKERYTQLNAEFQRTAQRDKKAFFSDQCKEIEENNIMGKTRDLLKKIRDTKGTFWRRQWQPTPVFLPGESQGLGSLVGCRLWGPQSQTRLK